MQRSSTLINKAGCQIMLLLLVPFLALAQGRTVRGKVTDAQQNTPLPGVTVLVKGTKTGTQTGADGTFSITVPGNDAQLIFSFIGYGTKEVPVGASGELNVALPPDVRSLQDLVVVGYGTQKRSVVTAAVTTVKADDFNAGGTRNAMDLIQGKVAGLTITRTQGNNPNSGVSIQLRGIVSLSGDRSPLVVIDGIPGGNLDLLQQDDIESFSVLKDGSAAAIYGTRGNGGVILITTKKGKAGPVRFDYSTYVQHEAVAKKPRYLTAGEYRALIADPNNPKAGQMRDYGYSTDFYDELINKNNLSHYHNLAMSGGTEKSSYRASVYYNNADPITLQNWRRQYGGRLNINQRGLNDRLSAQINLATNFNKANLLGGNGGDFESAISRNPTLPVMNPDGTYNEDPNTTNPIARLNQESNIRDQQTTSGDAKISLEIIKGLTASVFGAIMRDSRNDNEYKLRASKSSQTGSTSYDGVNITPAGGGYARKYNYLNINRTVEPTLEYSTELATHHSINAVAGYSYQYNVTEFFWAANSGFLNDVFKENNLVAGNFLQTGKAGMYSNKQDNTLIAYFGRLNYAYKEKYMVQFILRREGSSRFGANYKWGNFPAVSAGWTISKEKFMESVPFVNYLKLRAGYGVTGNQGIPNYSSIVTLGTGNYYLNPDGTWNQTYGPSKNPNPNLRWEKKKEVNLGLDFTLLNNRLSGTIDVFRRRTEDLLESYLTQLPPFVQSTLYTNVGTIDNKGVELTLSGVIINRKDLTWNMDVTASTLRNKLVSFSNDVFKATYKEYGDIGGFGAPGNAIRTVEGGPLGSFFGPRFAGFSDDGRWLFYKKDGTAVPSSQITDDDKTVIGNGIPKYMASWSNSVRYKNFDLTVFFRGKFGFDILNTQEMAFGNPQYLPNNVFKTAVTKNYRLREDPRYSDYFLENGSFVKLDNVTIGYNLPIRSNYIRNLRIYATGRNLATITGYSGLDPELEDTGLAPGIDGRGFYPRTRSYTLGLNIGF